MSRLQCPLCLYDPDTVEGVNLAGQVYGISNVGDYKTDAMHRIITDFSQNYSIITLSSPLSSQSNYRILICGFDSMSARREAFSGWRRYVSGLDNNSKKESLFIDGRLTATEFQVFCITGEDTELMNRYSSEFLFDDNEASEEICSFKQTAYLANMIGGVINNLFVNFCANLCQNPFRKALPFLTKYNTDMMMFTTEN